MDVSVRFSGSWDVIIMTTIIYWMIFVTITTVGLRSFCYISSFCTGYSLIT